MDSEESPPRNYRTPVRYSRRYDCWRRSFKTWFPLPAGALRTLGFTDSWGTSGDGARTFTAGASRTRSVIWRFI